jgi:spermidine dehydrogenase
MDDLVTARFDYARLDLSDSNARIRLEATAVMVRNEPGGRVSVGYVRRGELHRIEARHAIVATYANIMPYICPEIALAIRDAMVSSVRAPLVYSKVVLRSWESFVKLGVHKISAPMAFSSTVKLDYPVSLGRYRFPCRPNEPMCLHLVHVPLEQNKGLDARAQFRIGRQRLLEQNPSMAIQ